MRNLSIGVLLIAGGTVAALPFRRYQTIQDASLNPTEATGPTQSALGSIELEMLVQEASREMSVESLALKPQPRWPLPGEVTRPLEHPRHYDDVAVPIELSSDSQAFTAAVPSEKPVTNSVTNSVTIGNQPRNRDIIESAKSALNDKRVVEPLMDTFAINSPGIRPDNRSHLRANPWSASQSVLGEGSSAGSAAYVAQPNSEKNRRHPTATAVLASSPQVESTMTEQLAQPSSNTHEVIDERLPATPIRQREHHWIRQPD